MGIIYTQNMFSLRMIFHKLQKVQAQAMSHSDLQRFWLLPPSPEPILTLSGKFFKSQPIPNEILDSIWQNTKHIFGGRRLWVIVIFNGFGSHHLHTSQLSSSPSFSSILTYHTYLTYLGLKNSENISKFSFHLFWESFQITTYPRWNLRFHLAEYKTHLWREEIAHSRKNIDILIV